MKIGKFVVLFLCFCSILSANAPIDQMKAYRHVCETSYKSISKEIECNTCEGYMQQILLDEQNILKGNLEAFNICIKILEN